MFYCTKIWHSNIYLLYIVIDEYVQYRAITVIILYNKPYYAFFYYFI